LPDCRVDGTPGQRPGIIVGNRCRSPDLRKQGRAGCRSEAGWRNVPVGMRANSRPISASRRRSARSARRPSRRTRGDLPGHSYVCQAWSVRLCRFSCAVACKRSVAGRCLPRRRLWPRLPQVQVVRPRFAAALHLDLRLRQCVMAATGMPGLHRAGHVLGLKVVCTWCRRSGLGHSAAVLLLGWWPGPGDLVPSVPLSKALVTSSGRKRPLAGEAGDEGDASGHRRASAAASASA